MVVPLGLGVYVRDSDTESVSVATYCWKFVSEVLKLALMLADTGPHPPDTDALIAPATISVVELVSCMPVVEV